MDEKLYREWFIREVAEKAHFAIKDVRDLYKAMVEVIYDVVENQDELVLEGLCKFYVKPVKGKRFFDISKQKMAMGSDSFRVGITPSKSLLNLLRTAPYQKKKLENKEDLEE